MAKKHNIPKLGQVLRRAHKIAKKVVREELEEFMDEELKAFKLRLARQEFPSFQAVPLSEAYRDWKMYKGLDERTMIRTGHYRESIQLMWKEIDGKLRFCIGYAENQYATDIDGVAIPLPLNVLASIHEYGSINAGVPARPHWGPQLEAMRLNAKLRSEQIKKKVMKAIKEAA